MKKWVLIFILAVFLTAPGVTAYATTISYSLTNLGGDIWQYGYVVNNNTLDVPIKEFTIYFDFGLYDALWIDSSVSGWTEQVFNPEYTATGPQDGFYDVFAEGTGIGIGETGFGFLMSFQWFGTGDFAIPGEQRFEVFDDNLTWLDSGLTIPASAAVSEPPTIIYLCLGVIMLACLQRAVFKFYRHE